MLGPAVYGMRILVVEDDHKLGSLLEQGLALLFGQQPLGDVLVGADPAATGALIALEIDDRREVASHGPERGGHVGAFPRRHQICDPVEDLERPPLRRAQAQPAGDGVDVAVHGS